MGLQGEPGAPGPSGGGCLIIVAPSGGDFSSIQGAIDSVSPSPETPCTILVAAHTYEESIQVDKSHIHLKGAGWDRTTLQLNPGNGSVAIRLEDVTGVTISGFTIDGLGSGSVGIFCRNASAIIKENRIIGFEGERLYPYPDATGIGIEFSQANIERNEISQNNLAVYLGGSTGTISENEFVSNVGMDGSVHVVSSRAIVARNTFIRGEGITTYTDSSYENPCTTTIADNTFTDVSRAIGNYARRENCFVRIVGNVIGGFLVDIERGITNNGPAVIAENVIERCSSWAVLNSAQSAVIANNLLRHSGTNEGSAIYSLGTSTITGNNIEWNSDGVIIEGGFATVSGNTFFNNYGAGVSVLHGQVSIMGNTFLNNDGGCINHGPGTIVAAAANLCNGTLEISGSPVNISSDAQIGMRAITDIEIDSGQSTTINSGTHMTIESAAEMSVESGSNMNIRGGPVMDLKATLIKLNSD